MQLFGDLLRERGADVLAELDLAGEGRDAPVLADMEPRGDVLREVAEKAAAAGFLRERAGDREADEDAAAESLEERAAVGVEDVEAVDFVLGELEISHVLTPSSSSPPPASRP